MNETHDIAIVGGGAAGLAAAISAAQSAAQAGRRLSVAIFEEDERVGRSILATGNGRCNFSNEFISCDAYRNAAFVEQALAALAAQPGGVESAEPVQSFFESLGLAWRQEPDGRRYPLANKASVVLDVLRAAAAHLGVRECCGQAVKAIEPPCNPGSPFTLRMADGVFNRARRVIIACGGALESLDCAGLPRVEMQPVLGPLRCIEEHRALTRELDNIRVRCSVQLVRGQGGAESAASGVPSASVAGERACVASESGELLFRPYGVSGICIFDLSRFAQPADTIVIDFLQAGGPEGSQDLLEARYRTLQARYGSELTYGSLLRGLILPRVADALLKSQGLAEGDICSVQDLAGLARLLGAFELEVEGIGDARQCQVHRGGLDVAGFDAATMQAHDVAGLFAVGEALDVDGPCGGYNLHWAWASGLLAGRAAAEPAS